MSKRRILQGWLVAALAMTFLWGPLVTGEETTEGQSDEPALELDINSSPEEMEAQVQAYMKARRKAVEEMLAADPQWQPALRPSHVIQVSQDRKRAEVNNFCLDTSGNVLACCSGAQREFDNGDQGDSDSGVVPLSGEIRVFGPDGQQLQTWPLSFTPQAITAHRDGTVFVGGDGHVARLDRRGKVLATLALPGLPEKPARPKPSDEQAAEEPAADGQDDVKQEVEQENEQRQQSQTSDQDTPDDQATAEVEAEGQTRDGSSTSGSVFGALFRLVTGSGANDQQDQAMREYMARRQREVTGIAVTDQDLFVARSSKTGYAIWRMGHDFTEPVKIVDRLRGCCGQMDLAAFDGHVYAAENARKRVVCYDREGKRVGKFGSGDRKKASGFGSCCNPMNLCFNPAGDVIASESGPPDAVKRFSRDGEFLGVMALPEFQGGCVRVQVQMSPDGNRLFVLDNSAGEIHVFADPRYVPTHEQVATIAIPMGDQKAAIHSFCLAADGNLLAACGGERMVYARSAGGMKVNVVNEPSGIQVVSPAGELLDTWSLEITPQVVNAGPDGAVYCGGQGRLAKLTADGKVLLVADSPQVAELPPLPAVESEPEEEAEEDEATRKVKEEEKQAKIEQLNSARQTAMKELMELHQQVRAKKDDDQAKAQLEAELEKAMLQYRRIHEQLQQLTVDPQVLAARLRSAALRKRTISGIAVTGKDVFIACPASEGYGYDVWRTDRDFQNPQKIVTKLRGCCGQMDIQASDGKLYAAENSRKRVVCYDRDGNELAAWGKGDRKRIEDFGSCCNPMNARFGPGGELYTSEASLGRIKRYSADGEFLGLVGTATIVPGCKHVPIAISPDGDRVYLLDITRTHIVVLQRRETADEREPATEVSQVP